MLTLSTQYLDFEKIRLTLTVFAGFMIFLRYLFMAPANLRHLPKVPVLPLLWSYASGEVEDSRIKRLILPFANERGEGAVVVYALGRWIVHILDHKIAKELSDDIGSWPKESPPDEMLIWRFVGKKNVILSNGESWRRHSRIVKSALNRAIPIEQFVKLGKKLFIEMGQGGRIRWEDCTMRYTLDGVGSTALGHDFNAIEDGSNPFVRQYNEVMESIASPAHIVFPKLEKLFPRRTVIKKIDELAGRFQSLLENKKKSKGNDMLTYMLEEPGITDEEYRDNMVVFFIAGHDTTAGAMSSLVYFLAKHPKYQSRAREEALAAIGESGDPNIENLRKMPFILACIRESLRMNTPISFLVPRISDFAVNFQSSKSKTYYIPPKTSVILNLTSIHYNETYWENPTDFNPLRFMAKNGKDEARIDGSIWLPFGLGPRQCPARQFGLYELRTLTALLLQQWDWGLPADSPHKNGLRNGFSPFALSLPKDLVIVFKRRAKIFQ